MQPDRRWSYAAVTSQPPSQTPSGSSLFKDRRLSFGSTSGDASSRAPAEAGVGPLRLSGRAARRHIAQRLVRESRARCPGPVHAPDVTTPGWTLQPGKHTTRVALSASHGGAPQGGIAESARTPNVFLFSDPSRGSAHGYGYDGWLPPGDVFQYTGDGAGDQQEVGGNKAVINSRAAGRTLRLFVAEGFVDNTKTVRPLYVGEFVLADPPYVRADALNAKGELRSVYVFALLPVGPVQSRSSDASPVGAPGSSTIAGDVETSVADAESEGHTSPTFNTSGSAPATGMRVESNLVKRFEKHLRSSGHAVGRKKIAIAGELQTLWTDTYDRTTNELYEAKGSANRHAVRLALGQLLGYVRHVKPELRGVLLPSEPTADLIALLHQHSVSCTYEKSPDVFVRLEP